MNTPIIDYVKQYAEKNTVRFHMPGHKGENLLGFESIDLTEIDGADVLYSPTGIIKKSEDNASSLFSTAHSFYSAEGSSLTVKAMLYLLKTFYGNSLKLLAGRNAHKTFIYGCGLLDIEPIWLYGESDGNICECNISSEMVEECIIKEKANAVYLTSPDYLGNIADIKAIGQVCKKHNVTLVVDNAHGAYLKFLKDDIHPISLGADICCDSAHKTLPVITGGGYLHISKNADKYFLENARSALSLFATTSPSYLILQSLDYCNKYLSESFQSELTETIERTEKLKNQLKKLGFEICSGEKIKIVINAQSVGYKGEELGKIFTQNGVVHEFADNKFLVFMVSPKNKKEDFERVLNIAKEVKILPKINSKSVRLPKGQKAMSIRSAILSKKEVINISDSVNRVCASPTVSCPPAIPIVISGEKITQEHIKIFKSYNINTVEVVKNNA